MAKRVTEIAHKMGIPLHAVVRFLPSGSREVVVYHVDFGTDFSEAERILVDGIHQEAFRLVEQADAACA